jgi:A/G-specific adenine glycosylase
LPASLIVRRTESWFRRHQRPLPWRKRYEPYEIWVSEVMAQQTRIDVVLQYFERFVARFPAIESLAEATEDEVTAAWSGLGYYRRARMLREGARDVVQRFGGRLTSNVDELTSISGIGRYTAGAIASIAFDVAAPIVDGNVARVLSRLFAIREPPLMREAWRRAEQLVALAKSPRDFNQGLMEIGALICTPRKPQCAICPLRAECATRSDALPLPKAKPRTRELHIPLYFVTDRAGRVLMRRECGRLMTSMFHLPHGTTSLFAAPPLKVDRPKSLGAFRHTVTNRRITFEVFAARGSKRAGYDWIDPATLSAIPHPSYVRKALRIAGIDF